VVNEATFTSNHYHFLFFALQMSMNLQVPRGLLECDEDDDVEERRVKCVLEIELIKSYESHASEEDDEEPYRSALNALRLTRHLQ
jgi:hypothetical protein